MVLPQALASRPPPPPQQPPQPRPPRRRGAPGDPSAHRVANAAPFGPWSISHIWDNTTGRLIGMGANCHSAAHKDPLKPNLPCKKFVTVTATVDEDRARWLAKLWLLEGRSPTIQTRSGHVTDLRVHDLEFYKYGPCEADLDAEAARMV